MQSEHRFLAFSGLVSALGALGLGALIDDWRFTVFLMVIFAIPLAATAWQGADIIRINRNIPRRGRKAGGRP